MLRTTLRERLDLRGAYSYLSLLWRPFTIK
nr:MAG TPA: hypothetical protein [Caudoviricetes sp.]